MRVNLQPAYVLHRRPYRDTSALLELFTAEHGRISLVARGVRRQTKRGSAGAVLQPFVPLLVSFSGRSELKNLAATEATQGMVPLQGTRLFSGLYINELLMRLLHRNDAHPRLFAAYTVALQGLASDTAADVVLRQFEFTLLDEMGYRLEPGFDGVSGQPVVADQWYRYDSGLGLIATHAAVNGTDSLYRGTDLLAMSVGQWGGAAGRPAKRLLRAALAVHLGGMPLRSRELFRAAAFNVKSPPERPEQL